MDRRSVLKGSGLLLSSSVLAGCTGYEIQSEAESQQQAQSLADAESELAEQKSRVGNLTNQVEQLETELTDAHEENAELAAESSALEGKLADERAYIEDLQATIDAYEQVIQENEHALETLEGEVDSLEADRSELHAELDAHEKTIEDLKAAVEKYKAKVETANRWGFTQEQLTTLQELAETWSQSVVLVERHMNTDEPTVIGTGWFVENDSIATNAHVVADRSRTREELEVDVDRYVIWTKSGGEYTGELQGYTFGDDHIFSNRDDIGFLELSEAIGTGQTLNRGSSGHLASGDPLLQIGHPQYLPFWTPSVGPFESATTQYLETSIPGRPGVSGSPVIDLTGAVVGMTWGATFPLSPRRRAGETPEPGDGTIHTSFEDTDVGLHSKIERIEHAYDVLV